MKKTIELIGNSIDGSIFLDYRTVYKLKLIANDHTRWEVSNEPQQGEGWKTATLIEEKHYFVYYSFDGLPVWLCFDGVFEFFGELPKTFWYRKAEVKNAESAN